MSVNLTLLVTSCFNRPLIQLVPLPTPLLVLSSLDVLMHCLVTAFMFVKCAKSAGMLNALFLFLQNDCGQKLEGQNRAYRQLLFKALILCKHSQSGEHCLLATICVKQQWHHFTLILLIQFLQNR